MKDNPIQLEYLKSVLLAQLLLEANESLIFTTQYRQTIKNLINRLNKELEQVVFEEYTKVYKTDFGLSATGVRKLVNSIMAEIAVLNR